MQKRLSVFEESTGKELREFEDNYKRKHENWIEQRRSMDGILHQF
jgi:hypothetical protein